jgi:hypothetical protein
MRYQEEPKWHNRNWQREKKWLKPSDCSGTAIAFVISIGMGDSLVMLVVAAWWSSTNQSPQQSSMVQRQHNFLQNQS